MKINQNHHTMKKIPIILCILASMSCSREAAPTIDMPKIEAINTTEDMIEWMHNDCEQGYIDSNLAGAYIQGYYKILDYLQTKN